MEGAWKDTTAAEEAFEFFDYLHPEYLENESVPNILKENQNSDIETVLKSLSSHVDNKILSLLNVTLQMKYFNPKALTRLQKSKQQINRQNVSLRGWGYVQPTFQRDTNRVFQLKMLEYSLKQHNFEEKINTLSKITENINQYWNEIDNERSIKESQYYTFFPSKKSFFSVNGRKTTSDVHEILDAIIQEYKTNNILKELNIQNKQFLTQKPAKQVHHFTALCDNPPILEMYDAPKHRGNFAKTLNKQNKDYLSFLKYKENLVDIQIFMNVHSKMTLPLLYFAQQAANEQKPFKMHLFLFGNLSNPVDAQWITCFWKMCDNVGVRNGATFLEEAYKMGLKKAYKRTQCDMKWSQVPTLLKNEWIMKRVKKTDEYCKNHNITDWAVSINGEFYFDNPPFEHLLERALLEAKRLQNALNDGVSLDKANFPDWYKSDSILISGLRPPIEIDSSNIISLPDIQTRHIVKSIQELHSNDERKSLLSPLTTVYTIGYNVENNPANYGKLLNSIYTLDALTESQKIVFGEDKKTIVGPFKFDRELSVDQISYLLKYINISYHHKLMHVTPMQVHFIEIWRSYNGFIKQKRAVRPQINERGIVRSRQTGVTFTAIINPIDMQICPILEFMKLLSNCELVGVDFLPCVEAETKESVRLISQGIYYPAFTQDYVDIPSTKHCFVLSPSHWSLELSNGKWSVLGVIYEGYVSSNLPDDWLIRVDKEIRKPFQQNSYFVMVIPPGIHNSDGLNCDSVSVEFFYPHKDFYRKGIKSATKPEPNQNTDLYTFCWNQNSYFRQIQMIYTFYANFSSAKVNNRRPHLLLIDPWISILHSNITVNYLPYYIPPGLQQPQSTLWYVKMAKFYYVGTILPTEIDNVIFADESIVFRGDASRLSRVDWRNASLCAVIASSSDKGKPWGDFGYKSLLMGRPYHNSALICFKQSSYIMQRGAEHYLHMAIIREQAKKTLGNGDDEYLNLLQLQIQFLSLPEGTTFCSSNNNKKYASTAIAHVRCTDQSEKLFGTRPKKLFDQSKEYFDL